MSELYTDIGRNSREIRKDYRTESRLLSARSMQDSTIDGGEITVDFIEFSQRRDEHKIPEMIQS